MFMMVVWFMRKIFHGMLMSRRLRRVCLLVRMGFRWRSRLVGGSALLRTRRSIIVRGSAVLVRFSISLEMIKPGEQNATHSMSVGWQVPLIVSNSVKSD